MANDDLQEKQLRFCQEYLVDLNGKQAAIRAGYSPKTAESQASRLLSNEKVASRVRELREQQAQRTQITSDYVLAALKEVGERCLQKIPVMEWDYENKCMVQKTDEQDNTIWTFDSTGANRAFELLGKHVGIFEKDNTQKQPVINVNIE